VDRECISTKPRIKHARLGLLVRDQFNDRVVGIIGRHVQRYWLRRRKRQGLFAAVRDQQKRLHRTGHLARYRRQPNVRQLAAAAKGHAFDGSQTDAELGIGAGRGSVEIVVAIVFYGRPLALG
jgi:hypothetical protein